MIVVHLFEQHRSWSAQPFLIVRKSSVMKSLKYSTGEEECGRLVFSILGPVLEELGTTEILLQSQLYPLNQRVDLSDSRLLLLFSESRPRSSSSFPSNSTSLSSSISPSSSSTMSLDLSISLHQVTDL